LLDDRGGYASDHCAVRDVFRNYGVRSDDRITAHCDSGQYNGTYTDPAAVSKHYGADESIALLNDRHLRIGEVVVGIADEHAVGYQHVASDRNAAPSIDLREATDRGAVAYSQRRHSVASLVFSVQPRAFAEDDIPTNVDQSRLDEFRTPSEPRARPPRGELGPHQQRVTKRHDSVDDSKRSPERIHGRMIVNCCPELQAPGRWQIDVLPARL
jgi:hypothetical protein